MFLQLFLKTNPALLNLKDTVLKKNVAQHGRGVRRALNFLVFLKRPSLSASSPFPAISLPDHIAKSKN
jgi:hypothetical protein